MAVGSNPALAGWLARRTPLDSAWQVQHLEHFRLDLHGRGGTCSTCKHVGSATDSSYVA